MTIARSALLAICGALIFPACTGSTDEIEDEPIEEALARVPARGAADSLDIASWNIEWFGSRNEGPADEALQFRNVHDVIAGTDFDLWGVAEVVDRSQFERLDTQLRGYSGFLASDSSVVNGAAYYAAGEQKVGFLYKSAMLRVRSAKVILTSNANDFGGRPPLEAKFEVTLNGTTAELVAIVMHAKAMNDTASYARRLSGARALKRYLDETYPTQKVVVLGDYNDDLDASITPRKPSPYANFVNDSPRYTFATKALSDANIPTVTRFSSTIDHHLYTNELAPQYITGSVEAYRVDAFIAKYGTTTSDHYPVLSRFSWGND